MTVHEAAPIQVALVRVKGARVAGSVVSRSGRSTSGMAVRLAYHFGGFGSEFPAGVVDGEGKFATPRLPPGAYELTVAPRQTDPRGEQDEFAETTPIEVHDTDIDGLVLAFGPGASISGRVVAEPAGAVTSAVGMRVGASSGA